MAAIAIGAMLVFSVAGMKAFAQDQVVNDVAIDTVTDTRTVTETQDAEVATVETTVNYKVIAKHESGETRTPDCNPEVDGSVTIGINVPTGVTASTDSVTFDHCNDPEPVKFTSSTPGTYTITLDDPGALYTVDQATFTFVVKEFVDDGGDTGGGDTGGGGGGGTTTDGKPPEIISQVSPEPPNGDNGWYTTDVSIHWDITDDTAITSNSGCDDVTVDQDTTSEGRTITCEATSADGTSSKSVTIYRDATAPTVSLVGGPADGSSYFFGFLPEKPTCTAEDPTPGSGLVGECTVSDYGQSVGSQTVTATAKDVAGNTAEDANAYTVKKWDLRGFTQPVDMGSTVNTLKGGSTVPVKFEIFADTEFTSTSFNGQAVGTFSAKKVSCSTGAGTDDIEVTATGGTSFRYDSTAGQFIYNWQTPKGAGICYDTTFTDQSGSALTAHFKTK
jgi:hypothetical protein